MIPKLANLDIPIEDVTLISPSHNLGINIFDVGDLGDERQVNATVSLIAYVLGSLLDAKFSSKQSNIFEFLTQLVIAERGNIHTFKDMLKTVEPYQDAIRRLPKDTRDFFETEYQNPIYKVTRQEVSWRLWGMLKNPTFSRIFDAEKNPIDLYQEMRLRRLILIDTHGDLLQDGSGFFGRFFISQILAAARRRFEGRQRPVFVYIDEAYEYFDDRLARMLETARKARIGIILAHQSLDQAKEIQGAIMTNTSTKFAGGINKSDATAMAGNMHMRSEYILEQPLRHFAMYSRGEGYRSFEVPLGVIEREPKRSNYRELVREMERRYGITKTAPIEQPRVLDDEEPTEEM